MKSLLLSITVCALLINAGTSQAQTATNKDIEALRQSLAAQQAHRLRPASPLVGVQIGQSLNAYALRMQYSL